MHFKPSKLSEKRLIAHQLVVSNIIMWQTEISPSRMRGRLVASALTFLILGDVGYTQHILGFC